MNSPTKNRRARTALAALLFLSCACARADYFHDQGMIDGRVRTDYLAVDEGTVANPLTLGPPLYPCDGSRLLIPQPCGTAPTTWPSSNHWEFNGAQAGGTYWVLYNNNEPWEHPFNSGPPNQSQPRVEPGAGIFGFAMIPFRLREKPAHQAHLVLNNNFDNPAGIPFLSIAADADRGNGTSIGALNSPTRPSRLRFSAQLWDYTLGENGVMGFQLWTVAHWGGQSRMLFIYLFTHELGGDFLAPMNHSHWNWRPSESGLANGADVAYLDGAALGDYCAIAPITPLALGETRTYDLQLTALYRCASDLGLFDQPMPADSEIELETVGFANEAAGDGFAIWTSVLDVRMMTSKVKAEALSVHEPPDEARTAVIRERLASSCLANEACRRVTGPHLEHGTRPAVSRTAGKQLAFPRQWLADRSVAGFAQRDRARRVAPKSLEAVGEQRSQ